MDENNDVIEDILIGANDTGNRKKGKKGIKIAFIILLLLLVALLIGYKIFTSIPISNKDLFIKSISNANVKNLFSSDILKSISDKAVKENSENTSKITFSSNEEVDNIDISNLSVDLVTRNDVKDYKNFSELTLAYSGNQILKTNLVFAENEIGIFSDEVSDKYIGLHLDKSKELFDLDFDLKKEIDNIRNAQKIDLTNDEKKEYLKKYIDLIINDLNEEEFSTQENISIEKSSGNVEVTSYTLQLSQEKLKELLIKELETLKNDQQLLEKLIVDSKDLDNNDSENTNSENIVSEDENINNETIENNVVENDDTEDETIFESRTTSSTDPVSANSNSANEEENENEKNIDFTNILLGRKINNCTVKDLQNYIDNLIKEIKKVEGKGLTITVYASKEKTEKISVTLPNENTLDLELLKNEEKDNSIKLTYLYNGDDNILNIFKEDVETYSAENQMDFSETPKDQVNGFSLEISNVEKEASNSIDVKYCYIQDKSINQKVTLDFDVNGNSNANKYEYDLVITFSNDKLETKVIVDNNIEFGVSPEINDLNDNNCVFLDELSETERLTTLMNLYTKILEVYKNKMEEFNFLDTNVNSSGFTIETPNNEPTITIDEARDALYNKVSIMMRDAIDNEQDFTIKDLTDLTIDGHNVTTTITENEAIITVDNYKFKIDKEFDLTDVE